MKRHPSLSCLGIEGTISGSLLCLFSVYTCLFMEESSKQVSELPTLVNVSVLAKRKVLLCCAYVHLGT